MAELLSNNMNTTVDNKKSKINNASETQQRNLSPSNNSSLNNTNLISNLVSNQYSSNSQGIVKNKHSSNMYIKETEVTTENCTSTFCTKDNISKNKTDPSDIPRKPISTSQVTSDSRLFRDTPYKVENNKKELKNTNIKKNLVNKHNFGKIHDKIKFSSDKNLKRILYSPPKQSKAEERKKEISFKKELKKESKSSLLNKFELNVERLIKSNNESVSNKDGKEKSNSESSDKQSNQDSKKEGNKETFNLNNIQKQDFFKNYKDKYFFNYLEKEEINICKLIENSSFSDDNSQINKNQKKIKVFKTKNHATTENKESFCNNKSDSQNGSNNSRGRSKLSDSMETKKEEISKRNKTYSIKRKDPILLDQIPKSRFFDLFYHQDLNHGVQDSSSLKKSDKVNNMNMSNINSFNNNINKYSMSNISDHKDTNSISNNNINNINDINIYNNETIHNYYNLYKNSHQDHFNDTTKNAENFNNYMDFLNSYLDQDKLSKHSPLKNNINNNSNVNNINYVNSNSISKNNFFNKINNISESYMGKREEPITKQYYKNQNTLGKVPSNFNNSNFGNININSISNINNSGHNINNVMSKKEQFNSNFEFTASDINTSIHNSKGVQKTGRENEHLYDDFSNSVSNTDHVMNPGEQDDLETIMMNRNCKKLSEAIKHFDINSFNKITKGKVLSLSCDYKGSNLLVKSLKTFENVVIPHLFNEVSLILKLTYLIYS